jgi:hypothetical protein
MAPSQYSFRRGTDSAPVKLRCDLSEPDRHSDQHQLQRGPAWTAHSMHTHEWVYRDSDTTTVYRHRHRRVSPKHKRHSARLSTPEQPRRTAGDSTRHRHGNKWAHQSRTVGPIRPQQRQPTADTHSVIDSPTLHIDNGVSPATIGPLDADAQHSQFQHRTASINNTILSATVCTAQPGDSQQVACRSPWSRQGRTPTTTAIGGRPDRRL